MLTNEGKLHIKRYQAGITPSIAQSIAFGVGDEPVSAGSKRLAFEVGRSVISLISYDYNANRIVFKAPISEEYEGKIHEVALYSVHDDTEQGNYAPQMLTSFDSESEEWLSIPNLTPSNFITSNVRIGLDALHQAPTASATVTDAVMDVAMDLSGYSAADKFTAAIYSTNSNAASLGAVFMTDASNYYTVNFGSPTSGYKVLEATKGAAVATGAPNWEEITEIRVFTTAKSAGAANITWDGLRIEDEDMTNPEYVMVSRAVLAAPFTKVNGMVQEVEFRLEVTA